MTINPLIFIVLVSVMLTLSYIKHEYEKRKRKEIEYFVEMSLLLTSLDEAPILKYKTNNILITCFKILLYLSLSVLPFLIIRFFYLGKKVAISSIPLDNLDPEIITILLLTTIIYGQLIFLLAPFQKKELLTLHFYALFFFKNYAKWVERMKDYPSFVLAQILSPIIERLNFISEKEENNSLLIKKKHYVFLRQQLLKNNWLQKTIQRFTQKLERVSFYLPINWHYYPEPILILVLAYDLSAHTFYLTYYFSLIFIILVTLRKIKRYYFGSIATYDIFYIAPILYGKNGWEKWFSCQSELWRYVARDFRHELFADENAYILEIYRGTKRWLFFQSIPFCFLLSYHDQYIVSILGKNFSGLLLSFFFFLGLSLSLFLFTQKIFSFKKEKTSCNRINLFSLRLLLICQMLLYFFLFFKNSFILHASEILLHIPYIDLILYQPYTFEEKMAFAIEILQSNTYISVINPNLFFTRFQILLSTDLPIIREQIDQALMQHTNFICQYREDFSLLYKEKTQGLIGSLRIVIQEPKNWISILFIKIFFLMEPMQALPLPYITISLWNIFISAYKNCQYDWAWRLVHTILEHSKDIDLP